MENISVLYDHRSKLFGALCNLLPEISWKSKYHNDGTMYDGYFIAGILTPGGMITYHCEMKYWDTSFKKVVEIDTAPEWDGHTSDDVLDRIDTIIHY